MQARWTVHNTGNVCLSGSGGILEVSMGYPSFDCTDRLNSSGVMRMTVTVVVIMFELTGALNYILPTMVKLSSGTIDLG